MSDGIFGLTSPLGLLNKLVYDFKRLKADEGQQAMLYTAYDFFVTTYSLVDWVNIKFNDEPLMEVWPQYRAFPLDESAPQCISHPLFSCSL
jgi:hypothetical protein